MFLQNFIKQWFTSYRVNREKGEKEKNLATMPK